MDMLNKRRKRSIHWLNIFRFLLLSVETKTTYPRYIADIGLFRF